MGEVGESGALGVDEAKVFARYETRASADPESGGVRVVWVRSHRPSVDCTVEIATMGELVMEESNHGFGVADVGHRASYRSAGGWIGEADDGHPGQRRQQRVVSFVREIYAQAAVGGVSGGAVSVAGGVFG